MISAFEILSNDIEVLYMMTCTIIDEYNVSGILKYSQVLNTIKNLKNLQTDNAYHKQTMVKNCQIMLLKQKGLL